MGTTNQAPPTVSRQIAGCGTPESTWQAWAGLASAPRLSLDGYLGKDQRLIVVAPHPDDEVLACGGLMASHVARGGACLVVAVTEGEASHTGSEIWTPGALAATRRIESARGLARLGVHCEVLRVGLPDGLVQQHAEKLTSRLELALSANDVVVSTWRHDGHPDHEASGHAVANVCTAMGNRFLEAPVWMWHWATPGNLQVPWRSMTGFDLYHDAMARKRQALLQHLSQLSRRDGPDSTPILGAAIRERASRHTEYFFNRWATAVTLAIN